QAVTAFRAKCFHTFTFVIQSERRQTRKRGLTAYWVCLPCEGPVASPPTQTNQLVLPRRNSQLPPGALDTKPHLVQPVQNLRKVYSERTNPHAQLSLRYSRTASRNKTRK